MARTVTTTYRYDDESYHILTKEKGTTIDHMVIPEENLNNREYMLAFFQRFFEILNGVKREPTRDT